MLEFTTACWDFCQMLIIVFILKFILDKYAHHLGFADKMMLLVLIPASITAIIYTKGQTGLLPILMLIVLFIKYYPKLNVSQPGCKIISVFLLYLGLSLLFRYVIGVRQ